MSRFSGHVTTSAVYSATSRLVCLKLSICLWTLCLFLWKVMQFPERGWDVGVDYMFFRNNVPNAQKLSSQLRVQSQSIAYCCQCSWLSAECEVVLSPGTPNQPQWVCAGHWRVINRSSLCIGYHFIDSVFVKFDVSSNRCALHDAVMLIVIEWR